MEEKAKNRRVKTTYFNGSWLSEECDINMWILKGSTSTSFRSKVPKGTKDKTMEEAGK